MVVGAHNLAAGLVYVSGVPSCVLTYLPWVVE